MVHWEPPLIACLVPLPSRNSEHPETSLSATWTCELGLEMGWSGEASGWMIVYLLRWNAKKVIVEDTLRVAQSQA